MSSTKTVILLIGFLVLSFLGYGQESTAKNYSWKDFPANSSVDQLKEFRAIFESEKGGEWDVEQRLAYYHKGFDAAVALDAELDIIHFADRLGNRYHYIDSFAQAIYFLKYPIELAYDTITVARAYNRLGYLYFDIGDYSTALDHFFNSVKYGKLLNRGWETYPFGNITSVYKHLEDYDNAIKYTKASLAIDAMADFPDREYGLIYNYTNLFLFNDKKNQTDSCLYYIDLINQNIDAIDTIQNVNYRAAICFAHTTIANFYIKNNSLDLAKRHIDLAYRDEKESNIDNILQTEGKYWLKKGNYAKAKSIIDKYEDLSLRNFGSQEHLLELKIDYYSATNDYKSVARLQEELLTTQKDKFGDDRLRYSTFANAEFKNLEQQQRITDLENQRKFDQLNSRNRTYIALIAFLIIMGIAISLWYRSRQSKRLSVYLDEQVRIKTKDLEQANEELRMFNYIASHDIKEPIRNIGNYTSLVFRKLPDDFKKEFEDYFNIIGKSSQQLYTLIEDFARYSTMSKDKDIVLQTVDLNLIVENLKNGMDETIQKYNGQIINHGLPELFSSPSLIYIILKNLVENGLKFNTAAQPIVELSYEAETDLHKIIVQDNGIGIESDYAEKIFEMFSRLHNRGQYEGSGIGLAIVRLLLEKLKGSIRVESQPKVGSRFIIELPKG